MDDLSVFWKDVRSVVRWVVCRYKEMENVKNRPKLEKKDQHDLSTNTTEMPFLIHKKVMEMGIVYSGGYNVSCRSR